MNEVQRIQEEYQRRRREIRPETYASTNPVKLFEWSQRARATLRILHLLGLVPLMDKHVLEIGCGEGGWLMDFEGWGVPRKNLAGIDLDEVRVGAACRRLAAYHDGTGQIAAEGADIRLGNAAELPWGDDSFDLVLQSTVFTSILDRGMKEEVAREMLRVLKPDGIILWYDFFYNNPWNPNVRGIGKEEIISLFPNCSAALRRITLAPPLARKIVPLSWIGALVIEKLRLLNTHYLGIMRKRPSSMAFTKSK